MDGGMLAAIGQRAVTRLSLPERMLQPQALMQRVGGPALLAPFDAAGPLHILLEDYRESADLNLVGCFAARYDMVRLLRNLAALREREAREPEWSQHRWNGRSSSPACRAAAPPSCTSCWRRIPRTVRRRCGRPSSRCPAASDDGPARRIATMSRQLRPSSAGARLSCAHPIEATSPQECSEITAHVFRSFRFETTHTIPRYRDWLRAADHRPAYRFHRLFLQHLQHTDGRRGAGC